MTPRPRELTVSKQKTVQALSNPKAISVLQMFTLKPNTVSNAAEKLKISVSSCHYWVKQLLDLEILSISHQKKRAGSDIKYYWMAAEQLIINLGHESLENYYATLIKIYSELTLKGLIPPVCESDTKYSLKITSNSHGYLRYLLMKNEQNKMIPIIEKLLKPGFPAHYAKWTNLELSYEDAKSLQNKLYKLTKEYEAKSTSGQKSYFLQTTLVAEID